uniref:hypothetical protein n=1 Tax=Hypnea musciformis TaxID=31429 RepID=UPI0027DA668B|nr:hypothetical protein REP96_pgp117 [Hypnea musciformis]WCH56909.1 hypothetical protein [Hypnea musciformis]
MNYKNQYNIYNILKEKNTQIIIPEFFIRSILIPITYHLWLKILFLTARYELIILYILSFIQNKKIVFILALSSQLILLISQKISFLYTTIIIRNTSYILKSNQDNTLFAFYRNLLEFNYFQITRISYIIQIKKINCSDFSITNIEKHNL